MLAFLEWLYLSTLMFTAGMPVMFLISTEVVKVYTSCLTCSCRGRFDVFEDDNDLESPGWHDSPTDSPRNGHRRGDEREQTRKEREERNQRKFDESEDQKEHEFSEQKERDEGRKSFSGPLIPERVLSSGRGRDEDRDRSLLHTFHTAIHTVLMILEVS